MYPRFTVTFNGQGGLLEQLTARLFALGLSNRHDDIKNVRQHEKRKRETREENVKSLSLRILETTILGPLALFRVSLENE
jgi:hypothetical protein